MNFLLPLLLLFAFTASAQTPLRRIEDYNSIGWYGYEGDHKLGPRWEVHTEFQARRASFITGWQQSLLRGGLAFELVEDVKLGGGYAWVMTHPYGDRPLAALGRFPEHRFYEEVRVRDFIGRLQLDHRLRFEQRWLGVPNASGSLANDAVWTRQNRIRYHLMGTLPLQGPGLDDGEWYLNAFDEVFINFGRHVGFNVFDQNRVAAGLGYRVAENFRLEAHFLSQILQQPAPDLRTGLPVYEFNTGFRLGVVYNLTLVE